MNVRQKKKKRKKFLAMNNTLREPICDSQCPYCGFDACDYTPEEIAERGGTYSTTNFRSYFDGEYYGCQWTTVVKCPCWAVSFIPHSIICCKKKAQRGSGISGRTAQKRRRIQKTRRS